VILLRNKITQDETLKKEKSMTEKDLDNEKLCINMVLLWCRLTKCGGTPHDRYLSNKDDVCVLFLLFR
jgi:hypothetical protein